MKTTNWTLDRSHSEIGFKVRHLMITTVSGTFSDFEVTMQSEAPDFSDARISFSADVASITTGMEARDQHLRSADFFDADVFPKLTFVSTEFRQTGDEHYKLIGDLTIRDVTKQVELDVELGGVMKDPYGNTKVGFEMNGKLHRKDFHLMWDAVTEAGGVVVSNDVRLTINVQLQKSVEESVATEEHLVTI